MIDKYAPCPCGSGQKYKFCCLGKAKALVEAQDDAQLHQAVALPLHGCWVSRGWQDRGMATVHVARGTPASGFLLGGYLVDTLCLGVKNTFVHRRVSEARLNSLLKGEPAGVTSLGYEEARSLVLGAVEFARGLGFEPNADWQESQHLIEAERPFARRYQYGRDGRPVYVEGPDDNPEAILRQLSSLVARDEADFVTVLGQGSRATDEE